MKKGFLILAILVCSLVPYVHAIEIMGMSPNVSGTAELTFQSQYIWRGFDVYGSKSAVQVSTDLSLADSGFGVNVSAHRANASGFETGERWDYNLYYQTLFMAESPLATQFRLGYTYYNHPQVSHTNMDLEEIHAIMAWPNATSIDGLVPSYALVKMWPNNSTASGSTVASEASGYLHILMLDYKTTVPGYSAEIPELPLYLHSELVYNDGVDPYGFGVDHDWSHIVLGASTDLDMGNNISLVPAINWQITMDSSIRSSDDEVWATLGARVSF